jgi:hypothetical protein
MKLAVDMCRRLASIDPAWWTGRVNRPFFIVGCGRSGTTLLNSLFDAHPEVANFPSEANQLWHPHLYPWHKATIDAPPFWVDAHAFTRASLAGRTKRADLGIAGTFGAFQTLARRPVFLHKSVMITFMLDRVLEIFPDARFIHLPRDGRAVALSCLVKDRAKLAHPRYRERGYVYDDGDLLELYIRHWQDHVRAIAEADARMSLRERGRLFELSYEELCADPHAGLARLAAYMGISAAAFAAADVSAVRSANGKARRDLPAPMVERLTHAASWALAELGYGDEIAA